MNEFGETPDTLTVEEVKHLVASLLVELSGSEIHYSQALAEIEADTQVTRHLNGEGVSIW